MSKSVTLRYGGSTIQINTEDSATLRDVINKSAVREDPVFSDVGDNPEIADANGVIQSLDTVVSSGASYSLAKRQSGKG